ncbi:MAG: hypothetical protein QXF26_06865 [Candidatus Bathyarchaeia archaeon]
MIGNGVNGSEAEKKEIRAQTLEKAIFLILLAVIQTLVHAEPSGFMLQYDDGSAEYLWSDYYPNGLAVKFTPPAFRWKLTSFLIYGLVIEKGEKFFIIEVRDSDFNLVYRSSYSTPRCFKNATLEWAMIPLSDLVVKGSFYICIYPMLELNGTQFWIAVDNDTISNRSFLVDCYRQEIRKYDRGNVMIRVEGEEVISFVEITPHSIFIGEALKLAFRVTTSGNVTEVRATLQVGSLTEDCPVICKDELYEVTIDWQRLLGLKESAKLMLSARAPNTTASLTVELSEALLLTYSQLKNENALLRAAPNSSKLEREALERKLKDKEAEIATLRSSLGAYEKKWLDEVKKNERLSEELNILKFLTALLAVLTFLLSALVLRRRHPAGLTPNRVSRGGRR